MQKTKFFFLLTTIFFWQKTCNCMYWACSSCNLKFIHPADISDHLTNGKCSNIPKPFSTKKSNYDWKEMVNWKKIEALPTKKEFVKKFCEKK